ncbi:MAG: T9SS type A sorting domain-containing protein [Crocinitomicaceae bacterium]
MKPLFTLLGLSMAWSIQAQTTEEWQQIGDELTISTTTTDYIALEFDQFGTAYYAYSNNASNSSLNVYKMDGSWTQVGPSDITSGAFIRNKALTFDTLGVPIVAITDGTNNLSVLKFNGTNWDTLGVDGFAGTDGTNYRVSMTMDSVTNQPVVAYRDDVSNKLCIQTFNGTNWNYLNGGQNISVGAASLIDITVDYANRKLVAYAEGAKADTAVVLMTYDGATQWQAASGTDSVASVAPVKNLEIDGSDAYPTIGYISASDDSIYYHRLQGFPTWAQYATPIGYADFYTDIAVKRSKFMTSNIYPGAHFAYADPEAVYGITTKKAKDQDFSTTGTVQAEILGAAGFDSNTPYDVTFGIDQDDSLYVAFGSPVTAIKVYKLRTVSTASISQANKANLQIFPNPSNGLVTISTDLQEAKLKVIDTSGKTLYRSTINGNSTIDLSDLSNGLYFIQITQNAKVITKRIIIE